MALESFLRNLTGRTILCSLCLVVSILLVQVEPSMAEINLSQATEIAKKEMVRDTNHEFVLETDKTKEHPFGWVFFYNTKQYLKTGNPNDLVPGAGPFIVTRDGAIVHLSTSVPPQLAIEGYLRKWQAEHPERPH